MFHISTSRKQSACIKMSDFHQDITIESSAENITEDITPEVFEKMHPCCHSWPNKRLQASYFFRSLRAHLEGAALES